MVNRLKGIFNLSMATDAAGDRKKSRKTKKSDRDSTAEALKSTPSDTAKDLRKNMEGEKRIKELSASFYDMQSKMKDVEINNKGLGEELTKIRTNLSEMNDTMRNLLCIYEVITKSNNPFVSGGGDFSGYNEIEAAQARFAEEENIPDEVERLGASDLLMFSSLFQTVRKIENHLEHIFKKRMSNEDPERVNFDALETWYAEFKNVLEMYRSVPRRERICSPLDEFKVKEDDEEALISGSVRKFNSSSAGFAAKDYNRLMTSIRITEHYLEKIVVQKILGKDPSESDLNKLEHWYREFVNWR